LHLITTHLTVADVECLALSFMPSFGIAYEF
jgi:hypothetical protein